jgi:predicted Zn-dependent protease
MMMTRRRNRQIWLAVLLAVGIGCATVPYTNRSQLIMMSPAEEMALGADAYKQVLAKEPISRDPEVNELVKDVGRRIAAVAERPDFQWELAVIEKWDVANAFALPGGKMAVYTGLFPVVKDTAGLAAVIGHEVGHAIARHGAERMSQGLVANILAAGAQVALGSQSPAAQQATMAALGLGLEVGVMLPFSRAQEAEADHIGIILMAKAGYDPRAAITVWENFEKAETSRPPEFLSTHPNPASRQQDIRGWLPEALPYFKAAQAAPVRALPLRRAARP